MKEGKQVGISECLAAEIGIIHTSLAHTQLYAAALLTEYVEGYRDLLLKYIPGFLWFPFGSIVV